MGGKIRVIQERYANGIEVNRSLYQDSNGEINFVTQWKQNGREIGHLTVHPNLINSHGSNLVERGINLSDQLDFSQSNPFRK